MQRLSFLAASTSSILRAGHGHRTSPPVGGAFLGFAAAGSLGLALMALEAGARTWVAPGSALPGQIGVIAATLFMLTGVLAAYRALTTRSWVPATVAAVLLGPAAIWAWSTVVSRRAPGDLAARLIVLSLAALAVVLLGRGLRAARWLEVFCGLGALMVAGATMAVRYDPALAETSLSLSILATVAGATCLYGLLVEMEVAEHQTLEELLVSKERTQAEIRRTEDLLHDLRTGLLSIEAAIGSFDSELAGPVRNEAARLRRLTLNGTRNLTTFDLVPRVRELVQTRRTAGTRIDLRAPSRAMIQAEESEIMTIVDNLVANAERHGQDPIKIEIEEAAGAYHIAVTDEGQAPTEQVSTWLFQRGVTTHPEGTGVGLDRARFLAEMNKAKLVMEADDVGRTRFVLALGAAQPVGVS